uniref:Uncharacterized protein n=1 Tax=Hyaloperonospora arabidopsidis (strain Emoy2) TaxID=559515 RepID=M4BWN8_HYAAE
MHIFTREDPSGDYTVTFKAPMAYKLAIKHVVIGISMKHIALAIQTAKEVVNAPKFTGMNQTRVATFARVQCATNFQTTTNILKLVWAFSIALDASTGQGTSYVDCEDLSFT